MTQNTFNSFCHATRHTYDKEKNIISQFYDACDAKEPNVKIIINGPDIFGNAVKKNTDDLVTEIKEWHKKNSNNNTVVNLTGYSRGAITCIRAANIIKRDPELKNITINIFAIDPVAGMSAKKIDDNRTIPDNVKNFTAIYQLDEMRRDFKPQDLTRLKFADPDKTNIQLLPMYGNHSDTTKIKEYNKVDLSSAPIIVCNLLYQFLKNNNTQFVNNSIPEIFEEKGQKKLPIEELNEFKLLEKFSEMHEVRANFKEHGAKIKLFDSIPIPRVPRKINNQLRYYTDNHEFFINQYERNLFKKLYPETFKFYFENKQNTSDPTKLELIKMTDKNNLLKWRLEQFIGSQAHKKMLAFDSAPEDSSAYPAYNKLKKLEFNVYNLTLLYEREKSNFNIFGTRSQANRSQVIRREVYNLIHGTKSNAETKYNGILKILEKNYKELVSSFTDSELKKIIENILKKHHIKFKEKIALPNYLLANLCKAMLTLVIETFKFIASLGYLGGAVFSTIGLFLFNFGNRLQNAIGKLGYNPLKYLASLLAITISITGVAIKNKLGINLITDIISYSLTTFKDSVVSLLSNVQFEKIDISL